MLKSICPISRKSYVVPEMDERELIDKFVSEINDTKVVAVQGLGFVGAAMAVVVANADSNYRVLGVDLPTEAGYWKIGSFRDGKMPITSSDPKLVSYFDNVKRKENFLATHDTYAYAKADVIVVDINLDVQKTHKTASDAIDYNVDLVHFKNAMRNIGAICKEDALILVESTVPPGMCEGVILPILKEEFEKRNLNTESIWLAHSYERVMPGDKYVDSIENFYRVYSGISPQSADAAEAFLKTIIKTDTYPLTRLESTTATEMAKVLENSYRAANIAFMQEWTEFAEKAGVDLYDIISAIKMRPTHSNMMRPGLGVGGYCLTKDPLLASWSSENLFDGHVLEKSVKSVQVNDAMPHHTVKRILQVCQGAISGKKILLLGVSYLNDVGDSRFTPVATLYDELLKAGAEICLFDPYLPYWPERDVKIYQELDDVIAHSQHFDLCVLSTAHRRFLEEDVLAYLSGLPDLILVDTINFYKNVTQLSLLKSKVVIGKGD